MAWIKRNLYFFVGIFVALLLMAWGGYYLYTQYTEEGAVAEEIKKESAELDRLNRLKPNPGRPGEGSIDNVKAANDQSAALRAYMDKARPNFQRIAPIPDVGTGSVPSQVFLKALDVTLAELQRSAESHNVALPPNYYFTFQAQKSMAVINNPESLNRLAVHLGEVKALSELLFDARINTLTSIRREMVPPTDTNTWDYFGPDQRTVATTLAELTPYEVVFECFSKELADVMGNLANSPHCFVVKLIDVEPAGSGPGFGAPGADVNPIGMPAARFGPRGRGPTTTGPGGRGSTPYLTERLLRVTLQIQLVKPLKK